jgi:hypothetical protein
MSFDLRIRSKMYEVGSKKIQIFLASYFFITSIVKFVLLTSYFLPRTSYPSIANR